MRYEDRHIIRSEITLEILLYVASEGEAYATEIADRFDRNRSNVAEVMKKLEELNILKKTRRTQAQYYARTNELSDLDDKLYQYHKLGSELEDMI